MTVDPALVIEQSVAILRTFWAGDSEAIAALDLQTVIWEGSPSLSDVGAAIAWCGHLVSAHGHLVSAGEHVLAERLKAGMRTRLIEGRLGATKG